MLLAPRQQLGAAGAIAVGALIPLAYLVCEQLPATQETALEIGAEMAGIAAFAGAALAMVIGSYLKPRRTVIAPTVES